MHFLYQSPVGLVQATHDGGVTLINPMAAQLLMPLAPEGDLANLYDMLAPLAPRLREQAEAVPGNGLIVEDLRVALPPARPGGPDAPSTLAISLLRLDANTLMASIADASGSVAREAQRLAASVHDATHTDALTALPNRVAALEHIAQALARCRAEPGRVFGVLLANVDRFAAVNLSQGHAAGDALLRAMAARVAGLLRSGETQAQTQAAARLGGDEFVVVLDSLGQPEELAATAQRLVVALARPCQVGGQWLQVGASVGAVLCTGSEGAADDVLHLAALAMREAKRCGGGRSVCFEPAMKLRAAQQGVLELELREAIAQRQFFVVYQPILALDHGRCHAVEALVRWRHPQRGTVPPLEFIPQAEDCGLIGALGRYVLDEACAQMAHWQATLGDGAPRLMSVNLSRGQLGDDGLIDQVRDTLAAHGLAASALELEVTESLAAQDEQVQRRLHALRDLGVTLALDDFGTGYSSLACLHQLPVAVLKIDRSFVSRLESSAHHRVLVEATVRVARSLGMDTVAEGVETRGQAEELARLGCAHVQGYFYARPLPADEATRWLVAWGGKVPAAGAAPAAA